MAMIISWLEGHLVEVALAILVLLLTALVLFVINSIKLRKLSRLYQQLMRGSSGANLERLLEKSLRELSILSEKQAEGDQLLARLRQDSKFALKGFHLVRFDAFRDSGGEQSFSLSLVDANGDGLVLTNLHGREESYLYAKELQNWKSSRALTDEEKEAIEGAYRRIGEEAQQGVQPLEKQE